MMRPRWMFTACLIVLMASVAWAQNLNESFEETLFPPPAWQSLETGDGVNLWVRIQNSSWSHTGLALAQSTEEDVALAAERWLITPKLSVGSATDSVAFWVRTQYSFVGDNDSLYVLLSNTDSLPASFTVQLGGYKCGELGDFINEYVRYAHNLGTYNGQDVFVAFLHRDEGDAGNRLYFDDVTGPFVQAPPYQAKTPDPANHAVGVAANANLSWVNGAGTSTIDLYFAQTFDSVNNSIAAARKIDNVLATSYDPPSDLASGQQYFWKVVTRNTYGETAGPVWDFTVVDLTLNGSYDIGGGDNDYANFSAAAAALIGNGVSGPVVFHVFGGDYDDSLSLGSVTGSSVTNTITFRDSSGTARLNPTTATAAGAVHLTGADYVIFDGIDIVAGGVTRACVKIEGTSQHNRFKNSTYTGNGLVSSVSYAVYMLGASNDDNRFQDLTVTSARRGFHLSSFTGANQQSKGVIVERCAISDVWLGVQATYQDGLHVRDCDIQLNGAGNTGGYGLFVETQVDGDTVYFYRNEVHNIVASGQSGMVRANPGAMARVVRIYNNFLYDLALTGTAQMRGISAEAGTVQIYNNSLRCNDIAATATTNAAIYTTSGSTGNYDIRNNIIECLEQTNTTYALYMLLSGATLTLDYNAYHGTGTPITVYRTAYVGSSQYYVTFQGLQDSTAYEDHGVEGNPGFTSATDLHIQNTYNLVSNNGLHIDGIDDDIDQDPRSAGNPDIGADEYTYLAPAADYAVTEVIGWSYLNPEFTLLHPRARVVNRGSAAQTNVPVVLFFDGTPQDTLLVSLAVDEADTVDFDWTTPAARDTGNLEAQSFLTADADLSNDSAMVVVVIVGQPMHGSYDIGGGNNDYTNFSSAAEDLTLRGMDAAVVFEVYGSSYADSLVLGAINGASATYTITFREHVTTLDEPVVITRASGQGVVRLNGADYVTLDGIDVTAAGTCVRAVQIFGDADYNTVKNGIITGSSVSGATWGVHVQSGGNDYNTFDSLTVTGGNYGINLAGVTGTVDIANEVKHCTVLDGKYGLATTYQRGSRLHDCDVQPGWGAAAAEVYGLYAISQNAGDTVFFYNNEIHNLRTSAANAANGIYITGNPVRMFNNFVYDFVNTGTGVVYGIRVAGGSAELYFNSVHIGNVGTTGNANGFYQAGTSTAILKNNIFQIEEPTTACWAINRSAGTLTSDYNCVYSSGPGALYNMGRDASTNWATLALWQANTTYDANSIEGNPGYVSVTDLHIQETTDFVDGAGLAVDGIGTDIDGDTRAGVPDIGADEYDYLALAHDYAVNRFIGMTGLYQGNTPVVISAEVTNNGSNAETDVPIVLFYNGTPRDTVLLSLAASTLDTVDFNWLTPDVGYEVGELKAKAFCPGDGYSDNDSTTGSVTLYGGPMHGVYDVGGGDNDYATFGETIQSLYLRGMDAEVIFDVYGGTYAERVTLRNPIPGASFTDRVIYRNHQSALDDIVTLAPPGDTAAVVVIDSCDFITFDGINVTCSNATYTGYWVDNDADYITIRNAVIVGRDSSVTTARGIVVQHDACDNVTIDGCTISNCFYGIMTFMGRTNTESADLEIKNCSISGGNYNLFLDNCPNARAHHNVLQPSGADAVDVQGVLVESQNAGDTVYVYSNRIFNIRRYSRTTSANLSGIQARPGTGAYAYVYNNMIWGHVSPDLRQKGVINGILCGGGNTFVYNNSIRIANMVNDSLGVIAGINMTSATSVITLNNNIILVAEDDTTYALRRGAANTLTSDYNCFYSTQANFWVGFSSSTPYLTLGDWQTQGYDAHSVAGDPGFISATDLHIDSVFILVESAGLAVNPPVFDDIDGDSRRDPPDMGADEYHGLVTPDVVDSLTIFPDAANGDVLLRWTPSVEANSYKIYRGTSYDFVIDGTTYVDQTAATTYTHVGALSNASTKVYYVVIASTDHIVRAR